MLWISLALATPCPESVAPADFTAELEALWERGATSGSAIRTDVLALQARIRCLSAPLDATAAAAFHRNRALASLAAEDADVARASAAAARRLAPEASAGWATESPAFAGLLESAPVSGPPEDLVTSLAARVYTDGTEGARRFPGEPLLLQVFAADGEPVEATWLSPRDPTPAWIAFPPPGCQGPIPTDRIVEHAQEAHTAYEVLDPQGFRLALEALAVELPCADRVMSPASAAVVHRLEGVRLFSTGNRSGAVRAFQEAQILDPAYVPSETIAPEGSSIRALWDRAGTAASAPWLPIETPAGVTLWVDGLRTSSRPATLPSILQATVNGEVVWSRFVPATVPLPPLREVLDLPEGEVAVEAVTPAMALYEAAGRRHERFRQRRTARGVAVVLLGTAVGTFMVNTLAAASFEDPTLHPDHVRSRARTSNVTFAVGFGQLVGGAGLLAWSELPLLDRVESREARRARRDQEVSEEPPAQP
ncbi:MAG: hypothetical protein H6734_14700 [Alphaproteobacteria bacterium]|nr:hypothetical protein [Alphaproteobacteria bacterium]